MDTVLGYFEDLTDDINGAVYNCFFSIVTPGKAAGYTTAFTKTLVMWNILFNLGYMYTDIFNFIKLIYYGNKYYYWFAYYAGDFVMRFIYSSYVPRAYQIIWSERNKIFE
jgi:hypothetical protein